MYELIRQCGSAGNLSQETWADSLAVRRESSSLLQIQFVNLYCSLSRCRSQCSLTIEVRSIRSILRSTRLDSLGERPLH